MKPIFFLAAMVFLAITVIPQSGYAQEEQPEKTFENGDVLVSPIGTFHGRNFDISDEPYSNYLLGVYYDENPGGRIDPRMYRIPIKTSGMTWVKYNTENGAIMAGDPVTSSSTPGEAMKATGAGLILGVALEDAQAESKLLKIRVMVQYMR